MACCDASPVPYDVNVESGPEVVAYDGSVVSNPEARQTLKTLRPVITLRPKHGYSATKYDAKAVKSPKTLRRQSGRSYDQKKVRNKYTLEPNPDAGDNKNAPPQKLALAFSTADVVLLGWRLGLLADKLQENDLAAVRALSKRYAEVDRHMPFVASISITPIAKG